MTTLIPDTYNGTEPWQTLATCRDLSPELFDLPGNGTDLPEDHRHRDQIAEAKAACAACPVAAQCLAAALEVPQPHDRWAIAGNTTPRERAAIRRRRRTGREEREGRG